MYRSLARRLYTVFSSQAFGVATKSFRTQHSLKQFTTLPRRPVPSLGFAGSRNLPAENSLVTIKHAHAEQSESLLTVTWEDSSIGRFPLVYLRDSCYCPSCFDPQILQRMVDVEEICTTDYSGTLVSVTGDRMGVQVTWPDGHVSSFDANWLLQRKLPEDKPYSVHGNIIHDGVKLWDKKEMQGNIPQLGTFDQLMTDDETLYKWMDTLHTYGIALFTDVPTELGQLHRLGARVGHLRPTMYGEIFKVESVPESDNLAYTNLYLPSHCDLPYFEHAPAVQMLHCIKSVTSGGESLFVDAFNIATKLKEMDPESFQVLTKTWLPFQDEGSKCFGEYHHRHHRPPFILDRFGKIKQFTFNDPSRESIFTAMTVKDVQDFYKAYVKLVRLVRDEKNIVEHKLEAGHLITLYNMRVTHGRKPFEYKEGETRLLEVGYLDADCLLSKMRLLIRNLAVDRVV